MPLTIVQHRVPSRRRRRATDNMDDDVDAAETIMNGLHHHRASLGGSDVGGNEKIRGNVVAGAVRAVTRTLAPASDSRAAIAWPIRGCHR